MYMAEIKEIGPFGTITKFSPLNAGTHHEEAKRLSIEFENSPVNILRNGEPVAKYINGEQQ